MPARSASSPATRDPLAWCWLLTAGFLLLLLNRLTIPSKPFFDEIHYLPAARGLLELERPFNREHPLLGKQLIALAITVVGDSPFGWRIGSALSGAAALLAAMRAMWWASLSRSATLLAGVLLASSFSLFVSARIAMLDPYMLAFALAALWLFARALRHPQSGRRDLALCGVALGLAMASKWTAMPLAPLPGIIFAAARLRAVGPRPGALLARRDAAPVRGVSLLEAFVWLGLVPLAVYLASFAPAFFYRHEPLTLSGLLAYQERMAALQESVVQTHPYQSRWWQWLLNLRPIWYLYEVADGAQRGVLLIGNPLTMLAGLPALAGCLWWGLRERRWDMLAVVGLFAVTFGPWVIAPKPVQFYYHYLLPSCFLIAALSLVLARWWDRRLRWPAALCTAASLALFAWFYPILSAARLPRPDAFLDYTWLDSWR